MNYVNPASTKVERLLGNPLWREKWTAAKQRGTGFQQFLMQQYRAAMERIGYQRLKESDVYRVRTESGQVPLYYLLFFSKSERGYHFWRQTMKYSDTQGTLGL